MSMIALICPACSAPLRVDEKCLGRKGRCPSCGQVFMLSNTMTRPDGSATEDDVLSWLGGRKRPGRPEQKQPASVSTRQQRSNSPAPVASPAGETADANADTVGRFQPETPQSEQEKSRFNILLDHVDSMGAFFLFDSRLLIDAKFRSSFPRSCILCGDRHDLSVYPVLWSCKLRGKTSKNDLLRQGPYVRRLRDLESLKETPLLDQLKEVENVPYPYNLPFPYFVCASCSPVGALMTHVRTDEAKDEKGVLKETCELGISSLSQAEKFARSVCGQDTEAVKKIQIARKSCVSDAWRALPLAVRNRIKQWFKQSDEEKFVAYISDAEFAKAEAGSAGLVVTDQRIVYRKSLAQQEFQRGESLDIQQEPRGEQVLLILKGPEDKQARFVADPACVDRISSLLKDPQASISPQAAGHTT